MGYVRDVAPTTYVAPTRAISAPTTYARDIAIPSARYVSAPTTYVPRTRAISAPVSYVPAPTSYVRDVAIPSTSYVSAPTTYVEPMSYARDITWGQQRYVW